ncbi:MAG: hypothetical protein RLZZ111_96 [Planctomycetota bacterium]|jgi:hypothetical protein
MPRKSDTTQAAALERAGWGRFLVEVAAILGLFAAAGAWPVPDVNETAYLTKARHWADPSWCRGDFFLETPDAHGIFYLLMGPLAAAAPLEQAAWIGRGFGWLALAIGFRHAVAPLLSGPWARICAAALFSLALRHTTAAGEWVIGGCEAKVLAWALVLVAIGEFARGRFAWSWLWAGAATALHPIVGGWAAVAIVASLAWEPAQNRPLRAGLMRGWPVSAALVLGGGLLAATAIVPALGLSAGADAATRAAAAKIHVVERLSHHLLPRTFADGMLARHVLAAALWWLLSRLRGDGSADRRTGGPAADAAWGRLQRFILAALGIAACGHMIAVCEPLAPAAVHGLLRFYWFRLADVAVPFGLAVTAAAVLADDSCLRRLGAATPLVARGAVMLLLAMDLVHESRHWPLPGRSLEARSDTKVDAAAWRDACAWIAANTPTDACVLTPRGASSLTWRTGRREVVGWKNSPQDATSLVAWRQRFADCFSRDGSFATLERSTAALGADRMRLVADRYGATHAIVPRDLAVASLPGEKVYENRGYAVVKLPAADTATTLPAASREVVP